VSIEGQEGLTWPRWQQLVAEVEALGFAGLFLSDHFPNRVAALELMVALTYLADHSRRLHFGSLVAPVSFRDPGILARQAAALDDLSDGRMVLGLGTGWLTSEHQRWGYALGDLPTRSKRLSEALEVVTRLLRSDDPVTYEGEFYRLHGATLLPRPRRVGGPRVLLGGNGVQRTLPLVARYADAWNAIHLSPTRFQDQSSRLDVLLRNQGRQPGEVRRTLLLMVLCGRDEAELQRRSSWMAGFLPHLLSQPFSVRLEEFRRFFAPILAHMGADGGPIVGTPAQVTEQLRAYRAAGADELILQWFDVNDSEGLRVFSEQVLPHLAD
jgi:alkanesulfonate monooxygenase SsuD/methylene tetrahydromethanopterin reductase-like flavin-dependent oxidoreductase (luciferase family)